MSSVAPVKKPATRADLETLADNVVGEIIEGVLYTTPRPQPLHANVEGALLEDLRSPFQRGRGGPGGWWILVEPGIELPGSPEVVPDLGGWRRDRLPRLPDDAPIRIVPDWACEILSPAIRRHDQLVKKPLYARAGVAYLWIVDLEVRTLTACKLLDGRWSELGVYGEADPVRAEPFGEVELSMTEWWAGAAPR
jgi:Uma2 family endonuclease